MSDKQKSVIPEPNCVYCDGSDCDHKHPDGYSCGSCCAMRGGMAYTDKKAYAWIEKCLKAKNERIARLEARVRELEATLTEREALLDTFANNNEWLNTEVDRLRKSLSIADERAVNLNAELGKMNDALGVSERLKPAPTKYDELMRDPVFRAAYAKEFAESDREEMQAEIERLKAPVSDEEWKAIPKIIGKRASYSSRDEMDAIIASRAALKETEEQG